MRFPLLLAGREPVWKSMLSSYGDSAMQIELRIPAHQTRKIEALATG
jgi:hypothetical protein